MHAGNREDYLINILRLSESDGIVKTSKLASLMDVSPASVTEMLRILSDAGYVNYQKYKGVSLTPSGMEYARNIRRKHHIMERFLTDVLDIDHEHAHEEACHMEHYMSDDSANKICRIIGTKKDRDCSTCNNPCDDMKITKTALDIPVGSNAVISFLDGNDVEKVKKLISMGFVPGREINIYSKQNNGPTIIKMGERVVALDEDMIAIIIVENVDGGS